jgi:hypothetical protein
VTYADPVTNAYLSGLDNYRPDANDAVVLATDVTKDIQLTFQGTWLRPRRHYAARASFLNFHLGVTKPYPMSWLERAEVTVCGIDQHVWTETVDVPLQIRAFEGEHIQITGA